MNRSLRTLHRKLAPILFVPFLMSAGTGVAFYLGCHWFDLPYDRLGFLLVLHQGAYLGQPLIPLYVLLVGLGVLTMVTTGLTLIRWRGDHPSKRPQPCRIRKFHRFLAPLVFLPLTITAITGLIYRLGRSWFSFPGEQAEFWLGMHQGTYLGPVFGPLYILLLGSGLISMVISGIKMLRLFGRSRS
jgi:hypothetical protein